MLRKFWKIFNSLRSRQNIVKRSVEHFVNTGRSRTDICVKTNKSSNLDHHMTIWSLVYHTWTSFKNYTYRHLLSADVINEFSVVLPPSLLHCYLEVFLKTCPEVAPSSTRSFIRSYIPEWAIVAESREWAGLTKHPTSSVSSGLPFIEPCLTWDMLQATLSHT